MREAQATKLGDDYVSTEHLMVGLAAQGGDASTLLKGVGASPESPARRVRSGARRRRAG